VRSLALAHPLCWLASYLRSPVFFWTQVYLSMSYSTVLLQMPSLRPKYHFQCLTLDYKMYDIWALNRKGYSLICFFFNYMAVLSAIMAAERPAISWYWILLWRRCDICSVLYLTVISEFTWTDWVQMCEAFFFFFFVIRARGICPRCTATCRLIVLPLYRASVLDVPTFRCQSVLLVRETRETPSSERWNCLGENNGR
jgi:hypothetical protein